MGVLWGWKNKTLLNEYDTRDDLYGRMTKGFGAVFKVPL